MTDHWKLKAFDFNDFDINNVSLTYELDIDAYFSKLKNGLRQHEDQVGERVVIEWLESRGYKVERLEG